MNRQPADFVHLHVHSHYSLLDGAATIDRLVKAAAKQQAPSLAITDHGNMFGAMEFYKKARKAGVRPILGAEMYMTTGPMSEKSPERYHLVCLARNLTGYHNLVKLVSAGYIRGFYGKPRIDYETLEMFHAGLIGLSGCLQGQVQRELLGGEFDKACETAKRLGDIFGPEHFYLELQDHGLLEQKKVNPRIIELSEKTGVPMVVTNDLHYVGKKDAEAQEVLLCIQTGKTLEDEGRMRFGSSEFYMKSPSEMRELFPDQPEAYANTLKIANMCDVQIEFGKFHLPKFEVPGEKTPGEYLEELCKERIPLRYEQSSPEVDKRLAFELGIIHQMGFDSYFLITWDFIDFARKQAISVGPGRGSAAGSIVAYLLGITDLDPIKYGLLFERFLNPERVSMPDIDIDFCFERRAEVIDYTKRKYGRDNVCQIITFGTLSAKAAIKDVARALNIPFSEANNITNAVPDQLGISLEAALAESKELRSWAQKYPKLFEIATSLEGVARHSSTHAAGVVIAPDRLDEFVPLIKRMNKQGEPEVATQYDMKILESVGLLKMDFLGLKTLTVIRNTVRNIRKNLGLDLNIDKIPLDDKRSYRLLSNGETLGIFQFEGTGFRDLIKRLHPDRFEDLIAVIALYRPGPLGSGMVDDFIEAKHGRKEIKYPHDSLKGILEETYGVMLYQEQVMQAAKIVAGYTLGQADQLRRAMGKKIHEEMESHREIFIEGAVKAQNKKDDAERVFSLMEKFAAYGFNKSHSAAYALVSYQTVYLKANFPAEFMAAILTNEINDSDKVSVLIEECRRMKIEVLPPDINESDSQFTVIGKTIRFGLQAVKGLGSNAAKAILEARGRHGKLSNLEEFCKTVDLKTVNKRAIEALIKCGAFASSGNNRAQLLAVVDQAIDYGQATQKNIAFGQSTLFDFGSQMGIEIETSALTYPEIPEFGERELLNFEKECLGLYLSGHPLFQHRRLIKKIATVTLAELPNLGENEPFLVAGLIKTVRKRTIKSTKREMAFFILEGPGASAEFPAFPDTLEEKRSVLVEDNVVLIQGSISVRNGEKRYRVDDMVMLDHLFQDRNWKATVTLSIPESRLARAGMARLKNIILTHKGRHPVQVRLLLETRKVLVALGKTYRCSPSREFIEAVEEFFGEDTVAIQLSRIETDDKKKGRGYGKPSNVVALKGMSR